MLSELLNLIRFKGNEELMANREKLKMLEEDIRSRLLRKEEK